MGQDISTIFNILASSPGDLIYHLVVGLALVLILVLASPKIKHPILGHRARHVLIGCGILFILQIILLSISIGQQDDGMSLFVGILECVLNGLAVIWLVWTFIETDKPTLLTGVMAFVSFMVIILGVISIVLSQFNISSKQFEHNLLLTLWQSGLLLLALSGIILLLIKQPQHWGLGVVILILLAGGYLLQIGRGTPTNLMGAVRLVQIFSFPWLISLSQRFADKKNEEIRPEIQPEPDAKGQTKDTKPALIDLLLKINLTKTTQEKYNAVARALSLSVISDICYIMHSPRESQEVLILAGYDLIREEFLQTTSLKREQLPRIINTWKDHQHLNLWQVGKENRDAAALMSLLNYHRIGNLFAYPLPLPDQGALAGVVFLSPYTNKQWTSKIRQQMDEIQETLTQVLFSKDPKENIQTQIDHLQDELDQQQEKKEEIQQALAEKDSLIRELNATLKQFKGKYQKEKLLNVKRIDKMKERLQTLKKQAAIQSEEQQQLEQINKKLRQLIEERDQLRTTLNHAKSRIKELESQAGQTGPIRLAAESQIVSLDSIAANARLQVNQQLREKNLTLEMINPDGRQMIKTDPELLQRIFKELLQNAILASDTDEKIQLSIKVMYETGMLLLEVTDYGKGLTQEEQKDLFSADHEVIPGIGSVKAVRNAIQAIRALNGKIWLRSKKEILTTFRVQLPIRIID